MQRVILGFAIICSACSTTEPAPPVGGACPATGCEPDLAAAPMDAGAPADMKKPFKPADFSTPDDPLDLAVPPNADLAVPPNADLALPPVDLATPPNADLAVPPSGFSSLAVTLVYSPTVHRTSVDLAFHPTRTNELWVMNYGDDSVTTITNIGQPSQTVLWRKDPAAAHFMHFPTTIAFGAGGNWSTCGENDNGGNNFTGPSLFSSDPAIFAVATPTGLGSHLDMLHFSPWCMGVAHQTANVYWVFDDFHRALVKYDFQADHGPGNDDHSDGIIRMYVEGQVLGAVGVPSHLVFDPSDAMLYAADTGHGRIVKLNTNSGTLGAQLPSLEPSIPRRVDGATLSVVIGAPTLTAPSGIALSDGHLYVTDTTTSKVHKLTKAGVVVGAISTGLSAGSLAGITVGPDNKLYFVDKKTSRVYRVEGK